jgi:hypothetical protein
MKRNSRHYRFVDVAIDLPGLVRLSEKDETLPDQLGLKGSLGRTIA